MKKNKILALLLAFTLCFCGLGSTYVSAFSVIDITEETDSFTLNVGSGDCELSPNNYYPYTSNNTDGNLYVRMYNNSDNNPKIRVVLVDRRGNFVEEQITSSYRSTLYFDGLNPGQQYYFEFWNMGTGVAELEVEIM